MVTGAAAVVVIAEGLFDGACSRSADDHLPPCFYPEPTSSLHLTTATECYYKTKPGNTTVNQNQLVDLAFWSIVAFKMFGRSILQISIVNFSKGFHSYGMCHTLSPTGDI